MKKVSTKNIAFPALFAALTALGAYIRIPVPYVPFTLQSFFCIMSGLLLGPKLGALSQAVYVIAGLVGIPVFTEGGGPGYIFRPTFGYLVGFIISSYLSGKLVQRMNKKSVVNIFKAGLAGLLCLYAIGLPYLYFIYNIFLKEFKSLGWALYWGFFTTIWGDIASVYLLSLITVRILPLIRKYRM